MHSFSLVVDQGRGPLNLLVAQFSNGQSIEQLLDQLYSDSSASRRRASAVILRPDVCEHFTSGQLTRALGGREGKAGGFLDAVRTLALSTSTGFARFEDIPVFVLHSDRFELRLSRNINQGAKVPALVRDHIADPATLARIRSAELEYLVARSRALLVPVEGAYYNPPSGRAVRAFLRVGNVQYSRHALDAIAFWLLPYVARARALLIDTWSISSIALNVSRVLTRYDGRALIPVEMLSRYQDESNEAQAALLESLDRLAVDCDMFTAQEDVPITCLVSATQTGSLVGVLGHEIDNAALPIAINFVALFQLGKTSALDALCDLSDDPHFSPLDEAEVGARSAIHVDSQVYFPLIYNDSEYVVRLAQTRPIRTFLRTFPGVPLFSAHRDHRGDGAPRHHAVHLDTEALIETQTFQTELTRHLRRLTPPPRVLLTPPHTAGRLLGNLAAATLTAITGEPVTQLEHSTLLLRDTPAFRDADANIAQELRALGSAASLLILDDCFITGDRLTGYQTRLRQLEVQARLHYLVGCARPEHPSEWAECRAMLSYRDPVDRAHYGDNSVAAIYEICLPNWQQASCPWCAEIDLLRRLDVERGRLPPDLAARLQRLVDAPDGLVDDLFLTEPGAPPLQLFAGSIFADAGASQAAVFAAAAGALQQLRSLNAGERPPLGPRRYPLSTVLKASEYLRSVYTDSILRAALIRAGCREELVYMEDDRETTRNVLAAAIAASTSADVHNLTLELLIAAAAGKLRLSADAAIHGALATALRALL
jgi:hypothetical protein